MLPPARFAGRRNLKRLLAASAEERRAIVDAGSRRALEHGWVSDRGFTMPNPGKYPWQWLWDSCFHAIAWSALGDSRCTTELESLFALQLPSGFMPHMGYQADPERSLALWHSPGRSDITQPPMYGHALRVLGERGFAVDHLLEPAVAALRYLFEHRRDPASGMIRVLHPWETGCDDSPRWDGWDTRSFSERRWNRLKRDLVRSIELEDGAATANRGFDVGSAGFTALVSFNMREIAAATGESALAASADALAAAVEQRWVVRERTWSDTHLHWNGTGAQAPTLDALLPLLVSEDDGHVEAAFAELFDPARFWRPFGPSGVAADAQAYRPRRYWRGDAWPQLTYLMLVAARRRGRDEDARRLAEQLVAGCTSSCFAERWDPETGAPLGEVPQGWAALASEGLLALEGEPP